LPLTVRTDLQPGHGELPLQSFLSDLMTDEADVPDLLFVGVPGGEPAPRTTPAAALGDLLPVDAAKLLAAYGHEGEPGQIAETLAAIRSHAVRIVFLGLGDHAAAALRPAGAAGTGRPASPT